MLPTLNDRLLPPPSRCGRRNARGLTAIAAVVMAGLCLASGCSDGDDGSTAAVTTTAATSGSSADGVTSTTTSGDPATDPATDAADPADPSVGDADRETDDDGDSTTTSLLPAASGVPDQPATNSSGRPITLDETALLACAQNQIAWVALQRGAAAEASDALSIAATRAAASDVAEVSAAAPDLEAAASSTDPRPDVDAFLALCVDRGFEY